MLKVNIVTTTEEFKTLEDEWNKLIVQTDVENLFLTFDWIFTWWVIFSGQNKILELVTVRDAGELVAIAPLYMEIGFFSILKFMSSGEPLYPDYLNFIVKDGYETNAAELILKNINMIKWDYLVLSDLFQDTKTTHSIISNYKRIFDKIQIAECAQCPYIKLPDSYRKYYTGLSRNQRSKISNSINRLKKEFGNNTEYGYLPSEKMHEGLNELAHLHRKRWTRKKEEHTFIDNKYIKFHENFIKKTLNANKGTVLIYYLKAREKIISMIYTFNYQRNLYYYQSGFDPEYQRVRPGLLLLNYIIKNCIENNLDELDFLKGDHHYKTDWADNTRKTISIFIAKNTLKGKLALIKINLLNKIKSILKEKILKKIYNHE